MKRNLISNLCFKRSHMSCKILDTVLRMPTGYIQHCYLLSLSAIQTRIVEEWLIALATIQAHFNSVPDQQVYIHHHTPVFMRRRQVANILIHLLFV